MEDGGRQSSSLRHKDMSSSMLQRSTTTTTMPYILCLVQPISCSCSNCMHARLHACLHVHLLPILPFVLTALGFHVICLLPTKSHKKTPRLLLSICLPRQQRSAVIISHKCCVQMLSALVPTRIIKRITVTLLAKPIFFGNRR